MDSIKHIKKNASDLIICERGHFSAKAFLLLIFNDKLNFFILPLDSELLLEFILISIGLVYIEMFLFKKIFMLY